VTWLWVGVAAWLVLAGVAAVVLGRAAKMADEREQQPQVPDEPPHDWERRLAVVPA
jgi:hypothetical protein